MRKSILVRFGHLAISIALVTFYPILLSSSNTKCVSVLVRFGHLALAID